MSRTVAAATEPTRKERAAARDAEAARLSTLDAALAVLTDADCSAKEALQKARSAAAERLAATKPLGQRLADARRRHERAVTRLRAAEDEARRAAERASAALEEEHAAAATLAELESELLQFRAPPAPEVHGTAVAFLDGVDAWLRTAGMSAPPAVMEAAAHLRGALAPAADGEGPEETPTDLGAAPSPTESGEDDGDEVGAGTGVAQRPCPDPRLPPPTRRRCDGPYTRSASR